jgi:aldose 1-epimerase
VSRRSPSGRSFVQQVAGALPPVRLTVAEVGGGIRDLFVGERAILDGYGASDRATAGRGQILAPWPNRLRDGTYRFDGADYQLPLTDIDGRTAMHGLVRWLPWSWDDGTARVALAPQPGWPTWLELAVRYDLAADGLTVHLEATNSGDRPCPFGLGMHPYLAAKTGRVADVLLSVQARRWLVTDDRGLPVRWDDVADSPVDFRAAGQIGETVLDTCYEVGPAGFRVTVDDVTIWADDAFPYAQVFTGDTDPDVTRRRTALAVEPMTCPPDAFRSGEGLVRLDPGAHWRGSWGLQWPAPAK